MSNVGSEQPQGQKGSVGQKLRGATEVVHGLGDNLRGHFMDAVDSATNSAPASQAHPETHHGRHEVERGMAKLTGGAGAASTVPSGPGGASGAGAGTTPTTPAASSRGTGMGGQEGNVLGGPSSAMAAGFTNAGPESAVAQAPYQQQYSAGGAETGGMSNGRDFGHGAGATSGSGGAQGGAGMGGAGPAPDRYAFGGEPTHLG